MKLLKDRYEIPMGLPLTGAPANAGGLSKICVIRPSKSLRLSLRLRRLTTENLCTSAAVVGVHHGALAEEYAASSTTLVVVEVCRLKLSSVDVNKVGFMEVC